MAVPLSRTMDNLLGACWWQKAEERLPRQWQPASDQACEQCRGSVPVTVVQASRSAPPYVGCKRRRGAKKRLSSRVMPARVGNACISGTPTQRNTRWWATGKLGADQHQRWRCQACGMTFSCRRGTVRYYLKSELSQVALALWFLAEGVDISVLVRCTGRHEATLTRWLARSGRQSARWHNLLFADLSLALL
jgi:transposase-like protein